MFGWLQKDAEEVALAKNASGFSFSQSIKSNADLLLSKQLKLCFGVSNPFYYFCCMFSV
jgi:hypothetical protein